MRMFEISLWGMQVRHFILGGTVFTNCAATQVQDDGRFMYQHCVLNRNSFRGQRWLSVTRT